jgi:hypothetical protein
VLGSMAVEGPVIEWVATHPSSRPTPRRDSCALEFGVPIVPVVALAARKLGCSSGAVTNR